MTFARDTEVVADGPGAFRTAVAPGWDIGGNANGGYLLALAARALAATAGRPDPVTVTGHYLAPGRPGPARVETRLVKAGKRFATVSGVLVDAERPLLSVLGTFGDLSASEGAVERIETPPPELPPPADCLPLDPDATPTPASPEFRRKVDLRLHPDDIGFATGSPSGEPRVRGWFRFHHGEPVDTLGLLLATDAFPPTIFNAALPVAWTPTVELTCHVRGRPVPGWLRCAFSTRFVTGGFLEEDGEVWDASGRLVAQSRQLALLPRT